MAFNSSCASHFPPKLSVLHQFGTVGGWRNGSQKLLLCIAKQLFPKGMLHKQRRQQGYCRAVCCLACKILSTWVLQNLALLANIISICHLPPESGPQSHLKWLASLLPIAVTSQEECLFFSCISKLAERSCLPLTCMGRRGEGGHVHLRNSGEKEILSFPSKNPIRVWASPSHPIDLGAAAFFHLHTSMHSDYVWLSVVCTGRNYHGYMALHHCCHAV